MEDVRTRTEEKNQYSEELSLRGGKEGGEQIERGYEKTKDYRAGRDVGLLNESKLPGKLPPL